MAFYRVVEIFGSVNDRRSRGVLRDRPAGAIVATCRRAQARTDWQPQRFRATQRWPPRAAVHDSQDGRVLGFIFEARVNVATLNVELHQKYPVRG